MSEIIVRSNVQQDLYARALSARYQPGVRVYDPSFALLQDANIYEKIKRDAKIFAALHQRKQKIVGRSWSVQPSGDTDLHKLAAKVTEAQLKRIRKFTSGLLALADAAFRGSTFAFISGTRQLVDLEESGPKNWWIPNGLQDIDRRRFTQRTKSDLENGKLAVQWEFYSLRSFDWRVVEHPEWFIKHIYDDSEAYLGHGRGLVEPLFYYHWAKTLALSEGLAGLERWAQGMIIAKIDSAMDASDKDPNTTIAEAWSNELQKHRARHILVVDKNDEVTTVNMSGQGHQMVISFLEYLDNAMIQLILGALRPMGEGEGGARAQSETEADTVNDVINFDRELLSETITNDVIGLLWDRNRSNLISLGISDMHKPKFMIGQDKTPDPEKAIAIITGALQAQIPLLKLEVYERIGYTPPFDDDEVIAPVEQQQQQQFGPPGIGDDLGLPFQNRIMKYADCKKGGTKVKDIEKEKESLKRR